MNSRQGLGVVVDAGGGGLAVTGHLELTESEVIGNTGQAALYAGAFCNGCPLTFAGGGIHAGSVEGNRVTVAGNTAFGHTGLPGGPGPFGPRTSGGGGIAALGAVEFVNATLSANTVSAPLTTPSQYSGPAEGAAMPSIPLLRTDLGVRASRPAGTQPEGAPTPLLFEVINHGPSVASDVEVYFRYNAASLSWAPVEGTVIALDETTFVWRLASLASGRTVTLQGTASGTIGSSELSVQVTSRAVDFISENDGVGMNIGPAPNGTADLRVDSVEALPSPAPGQYRYRATVLNAGPASAPVGEDAVLTVNVTSSNTTQVVSLESADPRFNCYLSFPISWGSCTTTQALAPGTRVAFEFVIEGDLNAVGARPSVSVPPIFGLPDPNPRDNSRFLPAPP